MIPMGDMGLRLAEYSEEEECSCRCEHSDSDRCVSGRGRWCRYWFIVQWAMCDFMLSSKVPETVRLCLGGTSSRCWGSRVTDEGVHYYRFLVCVDGHSKGFTVDNRPVALGKPWERISRLTFVEEECFVDPFRCCASFLREDVQGWVLTMMQNSHLLFGDNTLREHLADSITEEGVYERERD